MNKGIATGKCVCGQIRYQASGQPVWIAGCCCRDCARATGTPYVVWVGFPVGAVRFADKAPVVAETSEGVLRGFCGQCGTSLTYGRDPKFDVTDPLLYLSATTLDYPNLFPPTEVVWYSQKPSWFELGDSIPLHAGVSPDQSDRSYNSSQDRQ